MFRSVLIAAVAAAACCSFAQPTPIGPFVGSQSDGYETQTPFQFLPQYVVFNGAGTVDGVPSGSSALHITSGWSFFHVIFPHSGGRFMGGAGSNCEYNFPVPATRFGGYFGTNADVPDGTATFFDANGNQLGPPQPIIAPLGAWAWNGWAFPGGMARIVIRSNNAFNGFIMQDDMQYDGAVPSVAGRVTLEDWLGPVLGRAVTIQIYAAGGGSPLETHNTTLDAFSQYSVNTNLGPGTYDVYAKASHWLRRQRSSVVFTGAGAVGVDFSLVNGDCDGDNEVVIGDYAVLSAAFGSQPGDPNWNPEADLNGDDEVTIADFAILSINFNMVGD